MKQYKKQKLWNIWFISSIIFFIIVLLVGTLKEDREYTNWPYSITIATLNLVAGIIVGLLSERK